MDSNNVAKIQLSDYTPKSDREKVDRKGWVNYGDDNLFPQYLRDLSQTSPVHGSLTVAISEMIAGKGIISVQYQEQLDALNINEVLHSSAHDLKLFGGFFLEVIYSNDRSVIAKINHLPFEECRIAINEDDENEIGIYHSYDWSNARKKKNIPHYIPKYNALLRAQEPVQVYMCSTYTGSLYYPRPDYWSGVNFIELEKRIGIFHVNNLANGMFPSMLISFKNGTPTPEQKQMMMRDWESKLSGERNAGKFIMLFGERDVEHPQITTLPLTDADKMYDVLNNTSTSKIIQAHRVTTPLLFGIRDGGTGFGSNKDEMETGLEIFTNQVIEPYQRKLTDTFEYLLQGQLPNVQFEIVPNTPVKSKEVAVVDGGTATDVAATALNGAQIASLVDIVMQSAAGAVPVSSAKAIVQAAFPTLPPATVDAIFADVISGSLQPTEVIQSTSLKKKVVAAEDSYDVTDEMAAEAAQGLEWRKEYGRGGTAVGVARARDISNKSNLSFDTVKRMNSYFARHAVDKEASGWKQGEEGFPSAGRIAWQLWGGDAGAAWAARIVERVKKEDLADMHIGEALIELGEDATDDMILIDAYNVDDELQHEFAVRTGSARPAAKSEQDAIIEGKYFITRYVYAGSFTHDNMRPFCKKMIEAGKLYRKEDITQMENVAVNPGWGAEGAATYDIWFYKGGGNCKHFWEKRVYVDAKGAKINPNDPDAKRIAVAMAERMGYKIRNNQLVAKLPEDMPYNGFLPTNPVYGNN